MWWRVTGRQSVRPQWSVVHLRHTSAASQRSVCVQLRSARWTCSTAQSTCWARLHRQRGVVRHGLQSCSHVGQWQQSRQLVLDLPAGARCRPAVHGVPAWPATAAAAPRVRLGSSIHLGTGRNQSVQVSTARPPAALQSGVQLREPTSRELSASVFQKYIHSSSLSASSASWYTPAIGVLSLSTPHNPVRPTCTVDCSAARYAAQPIAVDMVRHRSAAAAAAAPRHIVSAGTVYSSPTRDNITDTGALLPVEWLHSHSDACNTRYTATSSSAAAGWGSAYQQQHQHPTQQRQFSVVCTASLRQQSLRCRTVQNQCTKSTINWHRFLLLNTNPVFFCFDISHVLCDNSVISHCLLLIIMPLPTVGGGIKWWCNPSVCLSHIHSSTAVHFRAIVTIEHTQEISCWKLNKVVSMAKTATKPS